MTIPDGTARVLHVVLLAGSMACVGGQAESEATSTDESDTSTDESDTSTDESDTSTDESDTSTDETDTSTDETDTGTDETDTGTDQGVDALIIPPAGEWPNSWDVLELVTADGVPELQLGALVDDTVWSMRLSTEGELRWVTSTSLVGWPLPEDDYGVVTDIVQLDDSGATWITGRISENPIYLDPYTWIWFGRIEGDGSWTWLEHADNGVPLDTVALDDGGAAILSYVTCMHCIPHTGVSGYSALGADAWSGGWTGPAGSNLRLGNALERVGDQILVIGVEFTGGQNNFDSYEYPTASNVWINRISGFGALGDIAHASPTHTFAEGVAAVHDPLTNTLALAVRESGSDMPFGSSYVRLDALGETVLSWRSIGPVWARRIEPDGDGGAWLLSQIEDGFRFGHYGPDPDTPPTWELDRDHEPIDLAVDHAGGRAYVLSDAGIYVFSL